jgi:hypothetical protein
MMRFIVLLNLDNATRHILIRDGKSHGALGFTTIQFVIDTGTRQECQWSRVLS